MHTYIHTYIHTCMHACMHNYIRRYVHAGTLLYYLRTIHNQSQCHCYELRVLATQSIHLCTIIPTFSAVKYMFAPSLQLPVPGLRVWRLGFRVKPLTLISFHSKSWKGSSACEEMQGLQWVEGFGSEWFSKHPDKRDPKRAPH